VRSELLREVNDRIRKVGEPSMPVSGVEFVCECGGRRCEAMVKLTFDQYDGIRLGTGHVLAVGHAPTVA
jgi:hypothetical protein